jgi:dolichyl-phosphate-mannose-protein mannosyltransferase
MATESYQHGRRDRTFLLAGPGLLVPGAVFVLLIIAAGADRYFRDEFYYLACSHRMAWGYVDHPPLSIAILWAVRHLAGESLLVLRAAAALITAAAVWLTGSIARRLGADRFGETLAMVAAGVAPEMLGTGSFYSMNIFDVLVWTLAARVMIDILDRPTDAKWLALGAILGLGLLNKISVLWLAAGIVVGLIPTPERRHLLTRGPWLAGIVATLLFLPHVVWQIAHHWATLEFIRNASRDKMLTNTPWSFLRDQVLNLHPLTLPIWGAGLLVLLFDRRFARYRLLGIAFLTVAAILIVNRTSRSGYLLPAYPMLFGAGGVWWAEHAKRAATRAAMIVTLLLAGAATVPFAVPLLPVDTYVRYSRWFGIAPATEERQTLGRLPQFFADRQGWDRFVAQIGAVWDRLSPAERQVAAVFTGNYGEAGAIERLARDRPIPVLSGHNNYWLWGPGRHTGDVLVVLSRSRVRLDQLFTSVEQAGETDCGDCMPYENHLAIFICRGIKTPLSQLWPSLKHFE